MQVLFVHGMGRTGLSGLPMLRRLKKAGISTSRFDYFVSQRSFEQIRERLQDRIDLLASLGDYILIGHSLGGVLIRAALQAHTPTRVPSHVFLLGSPFGASRIARHLEENPLFRLLTRDCGHLLGSAERMAAIGPCLVPTTVIAGTREFALTRSLFAGVPNDGVVAVDEARHPGAKDLIIVDILHTWLPSSHQVANIILDRVNQSSA